MLFMLSEVILYFYYWYFVKFFKPNSHFTFTMDPSVHDVLSVPINHKYCDCTVFMQVHVHVCTCTCMNTYTVVLE